MSYTVFKSRPADRNPVPAEKYISKRFGSKRMQRIDRVEQNFARDLLKSIGDDATILDAPCGSGRFTPIFSRAKKMYALDINKGMLEEAKKKATDDSECIFIEGSILDIPLPENCVDLAFSMRLFHHVATTEERTDIFKELRRVSKKWVAITFYRKESWSYIRKKIRGKKINGQPIARAKFIREADECGLKLVKSTSLWNTNQTLALFRKV